MSLFRLQRQNPDLNQISNQYHGDNKQDRCRELENRRKSQTGPYVNRVARCRRNRPVGAARLRTLDASFYWSTNGVFRSVIGGHVLDISAFRAMKSFHSEGTLSS